MKDARKPILVLGIGNVLMSDDGVGVHVVTGPQRRAWPAEVELLDGGTAGLGLIEALAGRRKLIVIDAMDAGAAPGTIRRMAPGDLAPTGNRSAHDAGLLEALAAARMLGEAPGEVVIIGVQVARVAIGLELSEPVVRALPEVIARVVAEVHQPPDRGPA